MPEPTCDTCRHYGLMKQQDGSLTTICRRYPPRVFCQMFMSQQSQLATPSVTAWPATSGGDRCGEWTGSGPVLVS